MSTVAELLASYSNLVLLSTNKIKCELTGHEMVPDFNQISQYLNSKKFKKASEWYSYDYSQYLPYIIPHKENKKFLWCKLTNRSLNKIPNEIMKHTTGKKFLRLKQEYEDKKKKSHSKRKSSNDDDDEEEENELPSLLVEENNQCESHDVNLIDDSGSDENESLQDLLGSDDQEEQEKVDDDDDDDTVEDIEDSNGRNNMNNIISTKLQSKNSVKSNKSNPIIQKEFKVATSVSKKAAPNPFSSKLSKAFSNNKKHYQEKVSKQNLKTNSSLKRKGSEDAKPYRSLKARAF